MCVFVPVCQCTYICTCASDPTTAVGYWMFDCGEGTQTQLMRSAVKPGKLTKILITHLHGDHVRITWTYIGMYVCMYGLLMYIHMYMCVCSLISNEYHGVT